jgi:murein DD-endopeptidase MepM/ murein hydrolase activator NlpD
MGPSGRALATLTLALTTVAAVPATAARAAGEAEVAALQVALRARGLYGGTVDGLRGPGTAAGVLAFQRRAGLAADGIAGPATRRALGWRGRHRYGGRAMAPGARGWDVAALQFKLAWHGFPSGPFDGVLGPRGQSALMRFQRWSGLAADGVAGMATFGALRRPWAVSPIALRRPVAAPMGDRYGPRGDAFHAGLDFPSPSGAPVGAAASGVVTAAGFATGGWGLRVAIAHPSCVTTIYAHLSLVAVRVGQRLATGTFIGRVGATGHATGPHLHLEALVCGANTDPAAALR